MLFNHVTAEADMTVRLPDGNHEALAVMGNSVLHGTLVEITMTQAIPTGTSQAIRGYIAIAQTFDHAASELLETISHHRKGNDFKAKGGLSRVDIRPKGAPLIRLRLHGGTVVDVPSWTKAFRVKGTQDSLRDGPQYMNAETINTLELLGDSIDRFVGGAVLYRPGPGADFVVNAFVECALPATDD